MVTTLAAQLGNIQSQSTNPLDLKAQRKSHSHSILYEAEIAALQHFDLIFQICFDGFQELSRLDPRFLSFANTLFSDQSKVQDRTQMTTAQN